MHGFSYPASCDAYAHYQAEADVIYLSRFRKLLSERKDIILERSFYAKDDRDQFRSMAEDGGARVVLVFLRAHDKEVLWQRVCKRSRGVRTADSALHISREDFESYCAGFEDPVDEGEIVIDVLR
jgi:predicted kinase